MSKLSKVNYRKGTGYTYTPEEKEEMQRLIALGCTQREIAAKLTEFNTARGVDVERTKQSVSDFMKRHQLYTKSSVQVNIDILKELMATYPDATPKELKSLFKERAGITTPEGMAYYQKRMEAEIEIPWKLKVRRFSEAEKDFLRENSSKHTSRQLADMLDVTQTAVIQYCKRHKLSFISAEQVRGNE